jgi:hypothetical protein
MEGAVENNEVCSGRYEPVVARRNPPSVGLSVSSLYVVNHHLVSHSAAINGFTSEQWNVAEGYFRDLGPTPRICIDLVEDPDQLDDFLQYRQSMLSGLNSNALQHFAMTAGRLDLDIKSHTIFMVRRNNVDNLRKAHLEPISATVEMQIMSTLNELQQLRRIELYKTFASVDSTRIIAGLAYESLGHARLQEGITLTLKPMTKRRARKHFHWKFQGNQNVPNSMDVDSEISVSFPTNVPQTYEGELTSVEANRLYVPRARNEVALDSLFKLDGILYIFQLTVASSHDIKIGIKKLSGILNILPPMTNWRFVFITPPGWEVDVKATSEVEAFLEDVKVYLAHLEVEQQMNFTAPPEHV